MQTQPVKFGVVWLICYVYTTQSGKTWNSKCGGAGGRYYTFVPGAFIGTPQVLEVVHQLSKEVAPGQNYTQLQDVVDVSWIN